MPNLRIAYMTVDDAPTERTLEKMETFIKYNIPAIWYMKGADLYERMETGVELLKRGFILGNHAWSHPHFSQIPLAKAREEIRNTHDVLEAVYAKAGKPFVRLFRFPFGDKGMGAAAIASADPASQAHADAIQAFLRELGYRQPDFRGVTYEWYNKAGLGTQKWADSYWTFQFSEWQVFTGNTTEEEIMEYIDRDDPELMHGLNSGKSAEIILLHDHPQTNYFWDRIVARMLTKNFRFELPGLPNT